jgi:hypothetical protein
VILWLRARQDQRLAHLNLNSVGWPASERVLQTVRVRWKRVVDPTDVVIEAASGKSAQAFDNTQGR